jgi:hypothetical protein
LTVCKFFDLSVDILTRPCGIPEELNIVQSKEIGLVSRVELDLMRSGRWMVGLLAFVYMMYSCL